MKKHRRERGKFELQVLPRQDREYGLELLECTGESQNGQDGFEPVVRVWGDPLRCVMGQVLQALKKGGYRSTDLSYTRQAPFRIPADEAVRLGLLFLALKPLRKQRRMEEVAARVKAMELEEAYYWFSKATSFHEGRRALRAMRILLSEE